MKMSNIQSLEQNQIMSQSQIQALEILSMDNVELNEMMQTEFLNNPLIEHISSNSSALEKPSKIEEYYSQPSKQISRDSKQNMTQELRGKHSEKHSGFQEDISNMIMMQIDLSFYTKKEIKILKFLIECLDERGFFLEDIQEIAKIQKVSFQEIENLLDELRKLEPYGIFARNIEDCLLIQLKMKGVKDAILEHIIKDYLKEVSEGKIGVISRALLVTTAQVRTAISMITTLNPRPMMLFDKEEPQYITPDIIMKYSCDKWTIEFNDNWVGNYSLSDFYLKMMSESKDEELTEYFKQKYERAKFLFNSIEQRRNTILLIVKAIANRQIAFLQGNGDLVPMLMSDIAQDIEVHTSTISRAVRGKYLQCHIGTLQIKKLFSISISTNNTSGSDTTATAIKKSIKKYIEQENKRKPYSDQVLTNMFLEQGVTVSRRAIAKYRDELGIMGSTARKRI